jgi:hypothetical protein
MLVASEINARGSSGVVDFAKAFDFKTWLFVYFSVVVEELSKKP